MSLSPTSLLSSPVPTGKAVQPKSRDGVPGGAGGKEPPSPCRRHLISGSGRSPRGGHGNSLQYSCLDRGAWWATAYRVIESQTWLKQLSTQACRSWELCFIWWTFWRFQAQETRFLDLSENLLLRGERGARIYRSFCSKDYGIRTPKDYCSLQKTRHLKLRNLVLFYIWEDARV